MRRIITLLLVSSLMFLSAAAPGAQAAPQPALAGRGGPAEALAATAEALAAPAAPALPAPAGGPAGGTLAAGDWYVGATPPNADPSKPVLVFVHGKGGSASGWWGQTMYHGANDMYTYAYNHGYRTAFVDLHPEGTMWDNGQLLSSLLNQITAYFGVSKVVIVAHSKGGVDANAAAAHYGAAPKISRVITLGTPHWGTPLADLAYSSWASWLAELLGQRTEATYVMQTGYMEYFRSVTDGLDPGVAYRTVSGYKCGPVFTALWLGCMYISGEDDGVVPVWSTQKPGGVHLQNGYWDHDEIRMGSRVWNTIAPQLTLSGQTVSPEGSPGIPDRLLVSPDGPAASPDGLPASPGGRSVSAQVSAPGDLILRGGKAGADPGSDVFPLERGVKTATFHVLASHADVKASLAAPDGSLHPVTFSTQVADGEVFAGAWLGTLEVEAPAAGEWRLVTSGPEGAAYLMVAALEGGVTAVLDRGSQLSAPGTARNLGLRVQGAEVAESRMSVTLSGRDGVLGNAAGAADGRGGHTAAVPVPEEPGVYTVTVTVTGKLSDGSAFERTVVSSFAAFPR